MSFGNWLENGWLHRHDTSAKEVAELLAVVSLWTR